MPYKRYRKRKRYIKKKKSSSWLKNKGSGLVVASPFGKTFKFKTKYVHTGMTLNPGIGGIAAHQIYSANGLFDVDVTGVGHQPIGYDQVMPMYDHYTVIGSRLKITASNMDLSSPQALILSINSQSSPILDQSQVLENGLSRYCVLDVLGSGGSTKTMTINCNVSKFLGQNVLQSTACKGAVASNPTEQCYFHVSTYPLLGNDSLAVRCIVELEYVAILTEPKSLTPS